MISTMSFLNHIVVVEAMKYVSKQWNMVEHVTGLIRFTRIRAVSPSKYIRRGKSSVSPTHDEQ